MVRLDAQAFVLVDVGQLLRRLLSPSRLANARKVLVIEATRSDETESSFLFRSAFLVIVRHPDGDSHPTGRRTRRPIRRLSWTGLFLRRRWRMFHVVLIPGQAVRVRTDPLATAPSLDGDHLGVLAVGPRRSAVLLRAERCAGILAVLAGALEATVGLKNLAILVRLLLNLTVLCRSNSADASDSFVEEEVAVETLLFVALILVVAEVTLLSGAHLATLAPVFDDIDAALASEGIVRLRALAGIVALRRHLFCDLRLIVRILVSEELTSLRWTT